MTNRRSGMKIIVSLIGLLGKLKYLIIFAVLGGFLGNACAISVMSLGACAVAKIIDPSFTNISLNTLIILTICAGVLRGLLRFIEQYNNHYIAFKLLACLRDKLFGTLRKLAPAKMESKQKGALIAMLTADIETLEVFYAHTISPVLIAILTDGLVFILVSLLTNIYLGLIALLAYLIIGVVIPFTLSGLLKNDGVAYRKEFSDTSSYFLDSVKGINDIVINNMSKKRGDKINLMSDYMNKMTVKIKEKSSLSSSISNMFVSITLIIELLLGSYFVSNNTLSLPLMIIGVVMVSSSFGPVLSLSNLPANLTQTFASGDRILNLMEEKPEVIENEKGQEFKFENVTIENLSFAYNDSKVLNNINLTVNKGQIIGLIGKSGCGKSTLLKLLMRFYDVKDGSIKYNGIDIKDINTKCLHDNVTLVSQDTYLFDDSILNNLLFVRPNASKEMIIDACKKASIHDFIMSLPNGYDSRVGLLGDSLSAGEKQRIGLARAFLMGSNLILLDEVTSNVDAINEGIILKSLKDISKDKTIIIVSHRESTVSICDEVYKIADGEINGRI